jgi:KilA-N domain
LNFASIIEQYSAFLHKKLKHYNFRKTTHKMNNKIIVQNVPINITSVLEEDFICLTDMANAKESESRAADIIKNWLRNRYTLEFLGVWEQINNSNFKVVEFDHFKSQAGLPNFVISA